MDLSNTQRAFKLVINLCKHPNHWWLYIRYNFLEKGIPADFELPWWSFAGIEKADKLFSGKKIFEWGTGGSTIRYAGKAVHITSVEDDEAWLKVMKDRLQKKDMTLLC